MASSHDDWSPATLFAARLPALYVKSFVRKRNDLNEVGSDVPIRWPENDELELQLQDPETKHTKPIYLRGVQVETVLKLLAVDSKTAFTSGNGMLTEEERKALRTAAEALVRESNMQDVLDTHVQLTNVVREILEDKTSSLPQLAKNLKKVMEGCELFNKRLRKVLHEYASTPTLELPAVVQEMKNEFKRQHEELTDLRRFREDVALMLGYTKSQDSVFLLGVLNSALKNSETLVCEDCKHYRKDIKSTAEDSGSCFCENLQSFVGPGFYCKDWRKK